MSLSSLDIPDHCRSFYDPEKTRKWLADTAIEGFNHALNKINSPGYKLHVKDIHIPEGKGNFSLKEQKQAIMDKGDLTLPIKGTFQLLDKATGQVLDEKKTTIAHLPFVTERNTVIFNGSEYLVTNQQRLKPGVYTRIRESGEAEAHVNVKSGTGVGGKLLFHAEKAVFTFEVGTSQIKLYGLLHDLGVPDSAMKQAWGEEIFLKNKATYDGTEIDKFYGKIFKYDK